MIRGDFLLITGPTNKSYFIKNLGRDRGGKENISPNPVIIDDLDNVRVPKLMAIKDE